MRRQRQERDCDQGRKGQRGVGGAGGVGAGRGEGGGGIGGDVSTELDDDDSYVEDSFVVAEDPEDGEAGSCHSGICLDDSCELLLDDASFEL